MTDQIVRLGPEYFPRATSGVPISGGSIFIGLPDTDPEIVGNQIQVSALQENGITVPISQPILTSGGGVPLYNGAPVTLLVSESYSLKILDAFDVQIYNVPSTIVSTPSTSSDIESIKDLIGLINISSPVDDQTRVVLSFLDGFDKGGGSFYWDSTKNKNTANGVLVIDPGNTGGFDGTVATVPNLLAAQGAGVGFGCWIRTNNYVFSFEAAGALADDPSVDNSTSLQTSVDIAKTIGATVINEAAGDYYCASTITLTGSGYRLLMSNSSNIRSTVAVGIFAMETRNTQNINGHVRILVDGAGNGLFVGNTDTGGTDNSLYNHFSGNIQSLAGKSVAKPALGSGTVGIEFGDPDSTIDSNFFNVTNALRVRGFDTSYRLKSNVSTGANAQQINNPQVEDYWYGFDIDSDESCIQGGFAHSASGVDANNLTEAIHIRANRTLNDIKGMVIEPGAFASAGTIESGASNNNIDVFDNSGFGWNNQGSLNGIIDAPNSINYTYTSLLENTFYRLSRIVFGTNTRKAFLKLRWDTSNETTIAHGAGDADVIISRTSAGTISVNLMGDSNLVTGAGIATLRGFEIDGDDIYPVFFVSNNATATTSCVVNMSVESTSSGSSIFRHSVVSSGPTDGLTAHGDGSVNIEKLQINDGATILKHLSGLTVSLDFASIGNASFLTTDQVLTGAVLGDVVTISSDIDLQDGLFLTADVTAADTVKIQIFNLSGGAIDPPAFIARMDLWGH